MEQSGLRQECIEKGDLTSVSITHILSETKQRKEKLKDKNLTSMKSSTSSSPSELNSVDKASLIIQREEGGRRESERSGFALKSKNLGGWNGRRKVEEEHPCSSLHP